jgi:uncharacterized protein YndB with AHSA1/START domain
VSARLNRGAPRAVADVSEGVVHASVDIAAPAERVFRALASAELVAWWSTHSDYTTTKWQGDLRVGGAWRVDGVGADGAPFHVDGEFLEVDPPHKLVHTWRAGWESAQVTTVTYRLEPIPSGTRVTVRHEGFSGRPESCRSHSNGWERVLDGLRSHFPGGEGGRQDGQERP